MGEVSTSWICNVLKILSYVAQAPKWLKYFFYWLAFFIVFADTFFYRFQ